MARQELPVGISQAVQDPTLLEDLELGHGQVVGNGTMNAKSLFLSTAITWRFGQTPRSK